MENGLITKFAIEVAQAERLNNHDIYSICDRMGGKTKDKNDYKNLMNLVIRAMRSLKLVTNHGNKDFSAFENLDPNLEKKILSETKYCSLQDCHFKNGRTFNLTAYLEYVAKSQPLLEAIREKVHDYIPENEDVMEGEVKPKKRGRKACKETAVCVS